MMAIQVCFYQFEDSPVNRYFTKEEPRPILLKEDRTLLIILSAQIDQDHPSFLVSQESSSMLRDNRY